MIVSRKLLTGHAATKHEAWGKLREEVSDLRLCGWTFGEEDKVYYDHDIQQSVAQTEMILEIKKI